MITTHKDLANAIAGKRILHLNSLGKDAALTLDWLNNYAKCSQIVSVFFKFEAGYPTDQKYWNYLKKKYPNTHFVEVIGVTEINEKMAGMFQTPLFINYVLNNQEYEEFDFKKCCEELRVKYNCDYICSGISKYEGMGRALYLRKVGLLDEKHKMIFPIGLMNQAQVIGLIKKLGLRINPSYRYASESHDSASYFKMRNAFICEPEFKKTVYKHYPMLALDEYRFEVLFNGNKKA